MRGDPRSEDTYRTNASSGFLLVEMLATMTISALLLAALFSIASVTMRSSGRLTHETEEIEGAARIVAALSRDIARAAPIRWADKNGGIVFNGSDRSLTFASEVQSADGSRTIGAIHIESGEGIGRRVSNLPPGARSLADLAFGPRERMADDRFRLTLAYYGRLPDGRETLTDKWQDPRQLPVAVRLTLIGPDGASSVLRVKLDVDAEPGCAFPKKGHCNLRPTAAAGDDAQSHATAADDTEGGG